MAVVDHLSAIVQDAVAPGAPVVTAGLTCESPGHLGGDGAEAGDLARLFGSAAQRAQRDEQPDRDDRVGRRGRRGSLGRVGTGPRPMWVMPGLGRGWILSQ